MIPLPAEYGFIIYLGAWIVTIAVLWAREYWREGKHNWEVTKDKLCFCQKCHFAFLAKPSENIARCPRCNEICILRKKRGF